jgi:flagellar basal body-associated protein FliL
MDFRIVEEIIDKAKKQPGRIILIIVVNVAFAILMAYTTTFTSKKAEQHANLTLPSTQAQSQNNTQVEQQTEGDQSPSINVDEGNVIITYGGTE